MKIEQWDQLMDEFGVLRPVFYFYPDLSVKTYLELNAYRNVLVEVRGTRVYDGLSFGIIDTVENVPSCRPNYYALYPLYVFMITSTPFLIYPECDGEFEIRDSLV
jgi:hypothetical protein